MQYGEFIAQNRSIQHDKSCPIVGIGILQEKKCKFFWTFSDICKYLKTF